MKKRNGSVEYKLIAQLIPERNDKWLNSHIRPILEVWMANIDIQLIIYHGKVIEYLTKYMTKTETMNEVGIKRMFDNILNQTSSFNAEPQVALRKKMLRILGERTYGKQEISHLLNNLPIARSSHTFRRIHLQNSSAPININLNTSRDNNEERQQSVVSLTIVDYYARRMESRLWSSQNEYQQVLTELETLNLFGFLKHTFISKEKKIKVRTKNVEKFVLIITPIISPRKDGPKYAEYCKFMLMKYKPWTISIRNCIPQSIHDMNTEITTQQFINAWETYVEKLREDGHCIPEAFTTEISNYTSDMRALRENNRE